MLTVVERNHNPAATTADTAPIRLMTRHTRVAIGEIIPVAIAMALTHRIENLKTGDHQLDRYQNHDDDLQAQRRLVSIVSVMISVVSAMTASLRDKASARSFSSYSSSSRA
jgi:hypothetical protein